MKKSKNNAEYQIKNPETIDGIIKWLLSICKGHERYPHDTVKLGTFPVSYQNLLDLATRLKKAHSMEKRVNKKQSSAMVRALYWKNKNVLRHLDEMFERHKEDEKATADTRNYRFAMCYAIELQHLIHWYGYMIEYKELDENEPCKVHRIDEHKGEVK